MSSSGGAKMEVITNRYITIKDHIEGTPKESDFELKSASLPLSAANLGPSEVIVKHLYVSVDPYLVNRMKSHSSSHKSIDHAVVLIPGQEIDAPGVAKVVVSGSPDFEKDDLVLGFIYWGEYSVMKADSLTKLDPMGLPLSYHVGILGYSGFTAYAGFFEICKPVKGEKVFVSAACGSVGNLVGQYAKLVGCYVVGSAGSAEKVALLKEELGFDDAFNYREEADLRSTLKRYFPDGIDIYFDNVGAEVLEAAIANMNPFGRVAACGLMSEYTDASRRAAPDMLDIVYKRIKIQGFLTDDHWNLHSEFTLTTSDYIRNGKIKVLEDISSGVENIPSAFVGLFHGRNVGKKMVKIAEE